MATRAGRDSGNPRREIHLVQEDDGWWSAIDEETGVASQGETRSKALDNLDEAVALTKEARAEDTDAPEPDAPEPDAPEPDAPWFDE
ncbi:type II toxin-antitoxin system HicB family antitoxin [Halorussus lipolyticus]|uniref:type II toxin-antitoxin system HicB family antitoxin n=1 Tax=Halorussus lipolyticus TaxID=3034024 RepID=UPI0023E84507|nr:type II toxin-antitoxin system HicB family antitoxin [Halorussus sp. DT80]